MPYPRQDPLPPRREPVLVFMSEAEKLEIALKRAQHEAETWKNKYQSFIHPPVVTSVQQTMPVAQSGQQAMPVIQNVQQTVPLVPEPPKVVPTFTQANIHTRVQPYLNEPVYEILDDNDEGYQPRDRLREEIKTPLKAFHSKLFKAGLVSVSHIGCTSCKGCDKGCVMVRKDVQRLIDDGFLLVNQVKEVAAIEPTFNLPESRGRIPVFNFPAPNSVMLVFSIPTPVTPTVDQPKPLIIQKPSPFPFSDPKAVPWKYDEAEVLFPGSCYVVSMKLPNSISSPRSGYLSPEVSDPKSSLADYGS
ncbi:hypothetical protein KIW84_013621 [Lathyrus oleraceus]|uniref:Uncharacterized protein n=1 Tax=Pisum sativum TaxID=3888 RepID=A0A9D5BKL1_PEA|nr:hypothetical protein KIW84_013621 [Pisum sativum]